MSLKLFLHKHASIKKKILRFIGNVFMTKSLKKNKNIYNNTRANKDWFNYNKQNCSYVPIKYKHSCQQIFFLGVEVSTPKQKQIRNTLS